MTEVLTDDRVITKPVEPGDHDKMSHYVKKDELMQALVDGIAIEALCGKLWVPTRDGLKFPVCPECKGIYENTKFADD
jgi:hypothetical protein